MKIVINNDYGGFNLSTLAIKEYLKLNGKKAYFYNTEFKNTEIYYEQVNENQINLSTICFTKDFGMKFKNKDISEAEWKAYSFNGKSIDRTDKNLIKVIEKLKDRTNTYCSNLKIIEIPDDIDWVIEEYDGAEWIAEKHRTWE